MTESEKEDVWQLLFSLASVCGDLACTINDDAEVRKWLAIGAEQTRDRLLEIQRRFMDSKTWSDKTVIPDENQDVMRAVMKDAAIFGEGKCKISEDGNLVHVPYGEEEE